MRAIKQIPAGDEIFNDYGEIPRSDLLRRYGYVTDNYAKYDVVEIPLADICHAGGFKDIENQEYIQVSPLFYCLFYCLLFVIYYSVLLT